ncbi:MAG: hypothetical protein DRI71_05860 [Bacteroidetes bacterium]|nr:MAG: hypothetical protein DRI71_05860 [Bacteroidota bacterium]
MGSTLEISKIPWDSNAIKSTDHDQLDAYLKKIVFVLKKIQDNTVNTVNLNQEVTAISISYLAGLTIINNTVDANHDIDIAIGVCRDIDNSEDMVLSAITKQIDAAWAVGTNNGGLDIGTVEADTWYGVFIIKRVDTGIVDILFSKNMAVPVMPTSYIKKRQIGSVLTDSSSNIIAF